uniref:Leucine rich repeat containing 74B n=1 Tax=Mastacembelus armatus TaxID=205130 RepID=A0A3Q3MTI1_9TELE
MNLNYYGVGPLGAKALAVVLKNDYIKTNLELQDNALQAQGTRYVTEMLQTNTSIQNLSWNHIRMGGAVALSAGLKVTHTNTIRLQRVFTVLSQSVFRIWFLPQANSTLKELLLSWNGFGPVEAQALGEALKVNSTLVRLDLSSNRLDDQAVRLLCPGLASNDTLRVLKVSRAKGGGSALRET